VEVTVSETTAGRDVRVEHGDTDRGTVDIDYALFTRGIAQLEVYEKGVLKKVIGAYAAGTCCVCLWRVAW